MKHASTRLVSRIATRGDPLALRASWSIWSPGGQHLAVNCGCLRPCDEHEGVRWDAPLPQHAIGHARHHDELMPVAEPPRRGKLGRVCPRVTSVGMCRRVAKSGPARPSGPRVARPQRLVLVTAFLPTLPSPILPPAAAPLSPLVEARDRNASTTRRTGRKPAWLSTAPPVVRTVRRAVGTP